MVLAIAAGLGFLAAIAVYGMIRIFGRRRWTGVLPIAAGLLAIATGSLVFVASCYPVFHWAVSATTTTAIGASSDVADQVMAFLEMPPGTATDFSYRRSVSGTPLMADFQMEDKDYLSWMQSRGWNPKPIAEDGTEVYSVRGLESGNNPLRVARGWCYYSQNPNNPDNTEKYTFDAEASRVYVLLTLW
jgi:hypothetical protein